jgi:hypothetical protein
MLGFRPASWSIALVITLILVVAGLRFVRLEDSPPGFYLDEAIVASETISIHEIGRGTDGESRLFVPAGPKGTGFASPTHLYPKALWIGIAGYSISAMRAYAGLEATLLLAGLFFLGRLRFGLPGGLFALLAGSLSPWIFQLSRLAVDDPLLAVSGIVWGAYFFLRSPRLADAVLAAVCFSIAAYAYAAARIVLPPFYFLLWWTARDQREVKLSYHAAFFVTGAVACLPLALATLNGPLMSRYGSVGIFTPEYRQQAGITNLPGVVGIFFKNVALHFSPAYLFVHGDANLRHSTQIAGELSWLDIGALTAGAVLIALRVTRGPRGPVDRFLVTCAVGTLLGVIPAALTWEGLPHSVRSCASWGFFALLTAGILSELDRRWKATLPAIAIVALAFALRFFPDYFNAYPARAAGAFDVPLRTAAENGRRTGDWNEFDGIVTTYPATVASYYRMTVGGARPLSLASFSVRDAFLPAEFAGQSIKAHAPSRFVAPVPALAGAIRGGFGIYDGAYAKPWPEGTDGAAFSITHIAADGKRTVLLERYLDPGPTPGDRGIQKFECALPAGGDVELLIKTGPRDNNSYDWTHWYRLEFVPKEKQR